MRGVKTPHRRYSHSEILMEPKKKTCALNGYDYGRPYDELGGGEVSSAGYDYGVPWDELGSGEKSEDSDGYDYGVPWEELG